MRGGVPIFVAFAPSCFSIEAVHHLYAHQTSQEKLVSGLVTQIIQPILQLKVYIVSVMKK